MSIDLWMLTAGANAIMVVIYGLVSIEMIAAIINGNQLRSNPLLTATAAVFVTCTLGHGLHLEHTLVAASGVLGTAATQAAAQAEFADPRLVAWDVLTAMVAVYFYSLRSRFAVVYRGAALCEDLDKREKQAMEIHDNVVQGLVEAKLALDMGRREEGRAAIERTLRSSQAIITELLGKEGSELALGPGDLRRAGAS
ncbi:MAG: hypothetical protein ACYDDF_03015 [Thermoplasmatota archaeon]